MAKPRKSPRYDTSSIKQGKSNPNARKVKSGDVSYNARRRYSREAQRYMERADSTTNANERERLTYLAKQSAEKAMATYEKKPSFAKLPKGLKEVALRTGAEFSELSETSISRLVENSTRALEGEVADRRSYEGKAIMRSNAGSRIMAALEPIWSEFSYVGEDGKRHIDWKSAEAEIFARLSDETGREITDWLGVVEVFQDNPQIGQDLYADPENDQRYDSVVQAAQRAFNI